MKEYKFNIIGTGLNYYYQANIKIIKDNKIISEGKSYNGLYKVNLKKNNIYKIIVNNSNYIIYTSKKDFYFNINNIPLKKFILTDQYYIGLPIKKGVLLLWQSK